MKLRLEHQTENRGKYSLLLPRGTALGVPAGRAATVGLCLLSCATSLPAPEQAADKLASAVERGDAEAVHASLDRESRQAVTVEEVALMLEQAGPQIQATARAAAKPAAADVQSTVVLEGGERVQLTLENGSFFILATSALPYSATTPLDAVAALRVALTSRSYPALLSLLSVDLAEQMEQRLSSLAEALRNDEVLDVQVDGDHAVIDTVDGHRVELQLENGSWQISDIE